jgi:threonylcarbamoyladenosine tRNA methylthiotransferase MtaB
MKTAAYYTLGCKLNFAETSTLARKLAEVGVERVEFQSAADLYVINSCSVTEHADRKCRKVVEEALQANPGAKVVVIGCYAQLKPEEIEQIPGVTKIIGAKEKFEVGHYTSILEESAVFRPKIERSPIKETRDFVSSFSFGDRTRTFLKVQDGCDYFCAFCTIPLARGRSRNPSIAEVLNQAKDAASQGVKELVLTGVNIGDFGKTTGEHFEDLVRQLDQLDLEVRFRISSIEPNLLTADLIEYLAQSQRFVPHFHLPLQSGSDAILERMRRRYRTELYAERVHLIKSRMPEACIGVDVIVGFPGETEGLFQDTQAFLHSLPVDYLHVFTYSERENTTAIRLDGKVPVAERKKRNRLLRQESEFMRNRFYSEQIGSLRSVLWEGSERDGSMLGYSENYVRVRAAYDPLYSHSLQQVRLVQIDPKTGHMDVEACHINQPKQTTE